MNNLYKLSLSSLAILSAAWLSGCGSETPEVSVGATASALTSTGGLDADLAVLSEWPAGYCGEVTLKNQDATQTVTSWKLQLDLATTTLQNAWGASVSGPTGVVDAFPESWNTLIPPGQQRTLGFCVTRSSGAPPPRIISVTDDLLIATPDDLVELTVSSLDDFLYLTVNGLESKVLPIQGFGQSETLDVSQWFTNGVNEARVQIVNTGGPVNYSVQLRVNGELLLDESCAGDCDPAVSSDVGILLDSSVSVELNNSAEAQLVTFDSEAPGAIYLNDQYMGVETPSTLLLPPGAYVVGFGQGDTTPEGDTGRFFEQNISVVDRPLQVALAESPPLPVQNRTRIAILPVRETYHGGSDDIGLLDDSDIELMEAQALATSDAFVQPFSYGLTNWDITVLPVVENVPLLREALPTRAPDTSQLLLETGQLALEQDYDMIVFLYSTHQADGSLVDNPPCCAWAGGGNHIMYQTAWLRDFTLPGQPGEALYHETLHVYDWYNQSRQNRYTGFDSVHGAEIHGYSHNSDGSGWQHYYRDFARGQVAELKTMRLDDKRPDIPDRADLFVGIFNTMRYGSQRPR